MYTTKYKVWDKKNKFWLKDLFAIYGNGILIIYNSETGKYYQPKQNDYEIFLYTGLHDKHDKDIYGADWLYNGKGHYRTVHFRESRGAWYCGELRLTKDLSKTLELVGNKFENPEPYLKEE